MPVHCMALCRRSEECTEPYPITAALPLFPCCPPDHFTSRNRLGLVFASLPMSAPSLPRSLPSSPYSPATPRTTSPPAIACALYLHRCQ